MYLFIKKKGINVLFFILLIALMPFQTQSQAISQPKNGTWFFRESNTVFTLPEGWQVVKSTINDKPKTYDFRFEIRTLWGIYNPSMDVYMFAGGLHLIRSNY